MSFLYYSIICCILNVLQKFHIFTSFFGDLGYFHHRHRARDSEMKKANKATSPL